MMSHLSLLLIQAMASPTDFFFLQFLITSHIFLWEKPYNFFTLCYNLSVVLYSLLQETHSTCLNIFLEITFMWTDKGFPSLIHSCHPGILFFTSAVMVLPIGYQTLLFVFLYFFFLKYLQSEYLRKDNQKVNVLTLYMLQNTLLVQTDTLGINFVLIYNCSK